jgi:branched-chain amino acid transport system substrate-binding protein
MRLSSLSRRALLSFSIALAFSPAWAQSPAPIKLALIEGLSGPFANTGEAVVRNIAWAVDRVNARGGVKLSLIHISEPTRR